MPGGEDTVFRSECELLSAHNHDVRTLHVHNNAFPDTSVMRAAFTTLSNNDAVARFRSLASKFEPNLVHIHNFFPLLSPAVHRCAHQLGFPVVQTIHNYRFACAASTLSRNGKVCTKCLQSPVGLPALRHACYRGSRVATAGLLAAFGWHQLIGTWSRCVTLYIALTEFMRSTLSAGSIPSSRIRVKPNFLPQDPGAGSGDGGYALFVGRLAPEKGLDVLITAWMDQAEFPPIYVVGEGPLKQRLAAEARAASNVRFLGHQSSPDVLSLMKQALFLVVPSSWYEGFPLVLAEAFATGLPAIVSGHGSLAEIVRDGENGLHFRPGDPHSLRSAVASILSHPDRLAAFRQAARREFLLKYSAAANYSLLSQIYEEAIAINARCR